MERQTSHLERLIDDLVDIARINRDQIDLRREEVELASIVHHAVETCRPGADARRLDVDVAMAPEPIHLEGDPVRLAQVFSNLLNNACRYTDPGGRVWITTRREGPDAVVSVRDTGIGIPPEMLSSIFDIFIQLGQSPAQPQKGLGIGLTLVRRLVELHGGTVVAQSEGPGRGSEFVVRLPALDAPAKLVAPALDGRHTALVARRILIVDDNTDAAESMATLLRIAGHETHVAHDGDRALADANTLRPDVVLLDIGLPKLSGHDVARRIRAEGWGRDMVLVALTGWGQDEDVRSSLAVGFDHHLVKPVDVALLMRLVESPPDSSSP
jgi:CheY-like chemotaxis protein